MNSRIILGFLVSCVLIIKKKKKASWNTKNSFMVIGAFWCFSNFQLYILMLPVYIISTTFSVHSLREWGWELERAFF